MAGRVRDRAQTKRFNAKTLGEAVGVSKSSAAIYWAGKRPWPTESIPALSDALDLSVETLILGRAVDDHVKDRQRGFRGSEPERDADVVEIDEIDLRYGLGGTYLDAPVSTERRKFSREWLRQFTRTAPEHLFWTIGDGDSMEPTIRSGEVILVDTSQKTPRMAEGIWAVAIGEIGMIKRMHFPGKGRVELLSDNKLIPPVIAEDDELHVVGRVVAVVRRL